MVIVKVSVAMVMSVVGGGGYLGRMTVSFAAHWAATQQGRFLMTSWI